MRGSTLIAIYGLSHRFTERHSPAKKSGFKRNGNTELPAYVPLSEMHASALLVFSVKQIELVISIILILISLQFFVNLFDRAKKIFLIIFDHPNETRPS